MANQLTGDFEAVLQVSGSTLNRLLASMHQNAFANPKVPSLPHVAQLRIGDDRAIDGVRGGVQVQIGVPRLKLIHGSSDRFELEVGVRARYRADPESEPLAEIIHGTVRAQYRLAEIDPDCWGWRGIANDYLWIQVVERSATFEGTAQATAGDISVVLSLPGIEDRIAKQVAVLLATRFQATPHRVPKRFRRGALRSLDMASGAGVVVPIGLSKEAPAGRIDSVNDVFLGGADLALAISADYVEAVAQPALDGIVGLERSFRYTLDLGWGGGATVDYHVRVDSATAEWVASGTGLIKLTVNGQGWASRVYTSGLANIDPPHASELRMTFSAEQLVWLAFDAGQQRLDLLAPPTMQPSVTVNYGGPFGGEVRSAASNAISGALAQNLPAGLAQARPTLHSLSDHQRREALVEPLRTIDDQAQLRFERASFSSEGLVIHGTVSLAPRRPAVVSFDKTVERDGFTALQSWIPGGRIDSFHWSWTWFDRAGDPGSAAHDDRFLLLRPARWDRGKFGLSLGIKQPVPGLDGSGHVCLTITGAHVHPTTGEWVRVSGEHCVRFGYPMVVTRPGDDRLFLRDYVRVREPGPADPVEMAVIEAGRAAGPAANTLVVHLGGAGGDSLAQALRAGLEGCSRDDAGLVLLVLLEEGRLREGDGRLEAELQPAAGELGAALVVNEDVEGTWARSLDMASGDGPSWRLVSPGGGVTWMHDGELGGEELSRALDACLFASPPPVPALVRPPVAVGVNVGLIPGLGDLIVSRCPPPPLGRLGVGEAVITFVRGGSAASRAELERLAQERADDDSFVTVVVDGVDNEQAQQLADELGAGFVALGDPRGEAAARFGVAEWPSTVTLDAQGTVTEVRAGLEPGAARAAPHPRRDAQST